MSGCVLIIMSACKTHKKTSESFVAKNTEKAVVSDVVNIASFTDTFRAVDIDQVIVTDETITLLSKPDSTGKQYPLKVIDRKTKTVSNLKGNEGILEVSVSERQFDLNYEKKEDSFFYSESKTKKKTPAWIYVAGGAISIILIFILKKWKLL